MIVAGLLVPLAIAAALPAAGGGDDLGRYREIVTALSWSDCCGPGIPGGVSRRVDAVQAALALRYGQAAARAEAERAHADFNQAFGLYDPVGRVPTQAERHRDRRQLEDWYDERLDALEAGLGMRRR